MIIADSDILIDALRGKGSVVTIVKQAIERNALGTTAISVFELKAGGRSQAELSKVEKLLAAISILDVDAEAAALAAEVFRTLESRGTRIGMADCLIAGTCLARGAALLTGNRRHFERVPGLELV